MKKRTAAAVWLLVFAMALLQGCSAAAGTQQEEINPSAQTLSAADESMFTDRDREIGYSEAGSSLIKLKDGASSADGTGVSIEESTITISEEGTYILSGSLSNGQIIVDAPESAQIQLVLNGVEISNKSTAPIYVRKADKVFITTAKGTANTLSVTGEYEAIDDNNIDAVVFSKSDLTLNGAGTININAAYGHGVVSKDDLAVTCGNYKISAEKHGLSGKNSVRIAGGSFDITCTEDGIHSENTDDETLGFVYIEDGNFDISAGDDGVHASNYAKILGGNIKISKSYEGIEGLTIDISGGEISVVSDDDGLNSAGENDQSGKDMPQMGANMADSECEISISGGTLNIDASGDGIDSNGNIRISGGKILINGPIDDGNGAIDYGGTAEITGGTLLGAGSAGMAEGFSENSSQCSILYVLNENQAAGTGVVLKDSSGKAIAEFAPSKSFRAVYISVPELTKEKTYTLCIGSAQYSVNMDTTSYSNGGGVMGGRPGGFGGKAPEGRTGMPPTGEQPQKPETDTQPVNGAKSPQGENNDSVSSATVKQP